MSTDFQRLRRLSCGANILQSRCWLSAVATDVSTVRTNATFVFDGVLRLQLVGADDEVDPLGDAVILVQLVVVTLVELDVTRIDVAEQMVVERRERWEVRDSWNVFAAVASDFVPAVVRSYRVAVCCGNIHK